MLMNREKLYRVPDILDIIYEDVVSGLYSHSQKKSFNNRIKIAKFNLACDFLINSDINENEIVDKLDFTSISDFRILFKEYLGITPITFRKRFSNLN